MMGKIKSESALCTDKINSYVRFASSNNINPVQLKTGKSNQDFNKKMKKSLNFGTESG